MDPDRHDLTEIRRQNQADPWRTVRVNPQMDDPMRNRRPRPAIGPVLAVMFGLLILLVVLFVTAIVLGTLSKMLRGALDDEGLSILFYGFTLIAGLGALRLFFQRRD